MEAGPLAELAIPGLERRSGDGILDDFIDARAHLVHLLVVREHHQFGALRTAESPTKLARRLFRGDSGQVAENVCPAVMDEVFVLIAAADEDVEILHPPCLPSRIEGGRPLGIGLHVVANIDR